MSVDLFDYDEALAAFDPVLGLEVHVELNTASKMFCGCANAFGAEPNTQTCPVCLGLPGSLPVVNAKAIESAIRIGLALNCEIAPWCRFARKNYFYPDMTKDFQTSQYDEPIAFDGWVELEVDGETFRIEIEQLADHRRHIRHNRWSIAFDRCSHRFRRRPLGKKGNRGAHSKWKPKVGAGRVAEEQARHAHSDVVAAITDGAFGIHFGIKRKITMGVHGGFGPPSRARRE